MRRNSHAFRLAFLVLTLVAISVVAFHSRPSTASSAEGVRLPRAAHAEDGKMVAQLDYRPAVHGYGFRNYGRDHDNEHDLNPGNLIALFGAENVCQSGSTASDCVLT